MKNRDNINQTEGIMAYFGYAHGRQYVVGDTVHVKSEDTYRDYVGIILGFDGGIITVQTSKGTMYRDWITNIQEEA